MGVTPATLLMHARGGTVGWAFLAMGFFLSAIAGCDRQPDLPQSAATSNPDDTTGDKPGFTFRQVDNPQLKNIVYENGRAANMCAILEIVGGGVACIDYDLDGHCDLFFPGGGEIHPEQKVVTGVPSTFLRGGPKWSLEDVTMQARASVEDLCTHGATAADYDHDGFVDLLVYGYRGVRLLRNQGDGTFDDVTRQAGLDDAPWTTAAAWCDFDGDGFLDLYCGSYVGWGFDDHRVNQLDGGAIDVAAPNAYEGSSDAFYRGNPDGTFADDSEGLVAEIRGRALGVLAARFSPDEGTSIYVANDLSENLLFRLDENGQLEEVGIASGVAVDGMGTANGSMGVALLDLGGDQNFDLLVNNFEHEQIAFYRNEGNSLFRFSSRDTRLSVLNARVVAFGIVTADFDCDGDEDAMIVSGHVYYHPQSGDIRQPAVLLEQTAQQHFERVMPACDFFHVSHVGRGVAVADFDDDGDLDIVVTDLFESPTILENVGTPQNSWLRVRLVGRESTRTPIGTIVVAQVGEQTMSRQLFGGGSYLSQSQQELFFGWKGNKAAELHVYWPRGCVTHLPRVEPNQSLILLEPDQ